MKRGKYFIERGAVCFMNLEAKSETPEADIPYIVVKCAFRNCPNYEIFWGDAISGLWYDMVESAGFWTVANKKENDIFLCKECHQ